MMKLGIDSYSFHRYFGEVYPGLQDDPGVRWDMLEDFVPFAIGQQIDEVALETCFFPVEDDGYCATLAAALDDAGIGRVVGWGHPDGLHAGSDEAALAELKRHIPRATMLGAPVMRIVASSMVYADGPKDTQIPNVVRMLAEAVEVAEEHGVTLALENHIDFTAPEIRRIIEAVGSDRLRANLDTGNPLRVYEDPVACARVLAPYTVATHIKDVTRCGGGGTPAERFERLPSCPVGAGLVDFEAIVAVLSQAGFAGSLAVELDLLGPEHAATPEPELVAQSLDHLRALLARGPMLGQKDALDGPSHPLIR